MQDSDSAITPGRVADLAEIGELVTAAYGHYVERMGMLPGPMRTDYAVPLAAGQIEVLRADGRIAGLLVLVPESGHMLLDNVAVAPWAQGRGFGRRLMDQAEARARAAGYDRITLYTHVTMVENIEIYLRRGYVETHRAEVNGLHRVYMAKRLD
ncbi:MAG: GNAT family N-acetyltransferase [Rhodobacteraceae bacterium]|uniref:GNAT family N-acetyltransferase n=1 Tax=Salipiger thiooxidans TaxID=282683 RepID=UPI001A90469D|nr:GNAT family N-acetyltransferase [Salipiger thiooxidans]MBN8185740.1 GNAT family N-acetyltransferase [Salipiger thiooxidans]MBR9840617.1 GNAT family N-acetyltransferase [Paracoccaceae bacterium]